MKQKSTDPKQRLKKSLLLTWIIPNWLIFISFALLYLCNRNNYEFSYGFSFRYLPIFAILLLAHKRWVLYFSGTHFCTFYFFEGIKQYSLYNIVEISHDTYCQSIRVYFIENGKLKRAIFDTNSQQEQKNILNFLKDKVNEQIIYNVNVSDNFRKKKRKYRNFSTHKFTSQSHTNRNEMLQQVQHDNVLQNTSISEQENETYKISHNLQYRRWKLMLLIVPLAYMLLSTDYVQLQIKGSKKFITEGSAGSWEASTGECVNVSFWYVAKHRPEELDELLNTFLDTTNEYWYTQRTAISHVQWEEKIEYLDKLQMLKTYKEKQRSKLALSKNLDIEEVIKLRYDSRLDRDLRGLNGDINDLDEAIERLEKVKEKR